MEIRNKANKDRKVSGVTLNATREMYIRTINEVQELYPVIWWEPADIELWESVFVIVSPDSRALLDASAHVAGILNSEYRFVITDGILSVEKRTR